MPQKRAHSDAHAWEITHPSHEEKGFSMTRVHIEQGTIEGIVNGGVHTFLGVPYAAAPTGDRRWRPPMAPESWEGVREARHFGPVCP